MQALLKNRGESKFRFGTRTKGPPSRAQRGTVVWMVLREVFVLAAVGLAIGVPSALGTSRFVESFLFEVKPNSPGALVFAVATLLIAVLLAGYAPARKASRIDPMTAVRHE